jgi:hypothetical protein
MKKNVMTEKGEEKFLIDTELLHNMTLVGEKVPIA